MTKSTLKKTDPDDQLLEEYEKLNLILDETVKELLKIIDSSKTISKEKAISINLILNILKRNALNIRKGN